MRRALYHCNYCQRDISNTVRIKCAACPDFDLCLDCFSVGAAIHPHRAGHPYRVVDNLSFPLFHPDWGVRMRALLLLWFPCGSTLICACILAMHAWLCRNCLSMM
jgi:transcriptional adapter 2-alpha